MLIKSYISKFHLLCLKNQMRLKSSANVECGLKSKTGVSIVTGPGWKWSKHQKLSPMSSDHNSPRGIWVDLPFAFPKCGDGNGPSFSSLSFKSERFVKERRGHSKSWEHFFSHALLCKLYKRRVWQSEIESHLFQCKIGELNNGKDVQQK